MALSTILVPVDGSEGANRAIDMAAKLADGNDQLGIDVAYVVPIPDLNEEEQTKFENVLDMMKEDGRALLSDAVNRLGDEAGKAEALLLAGTNPAAEIVKLCDQRAYDLIVIGNRGLSGRKEYGGSVSYKVLHGSKTPVLIVK